MIMAVRLYVGDAATKLDLAKQCKKYQQLAQEAWHQPIKMEKSKRDWEMRVVLLKTSADADEIQESVQVAKEIIDSLENWKTKASEARQNIQNLLKEKPAQVDRDEKESWRSLELSGRILNVVEDRFNHRLHLTNKVFQELKGLKPQIPAPENNSYLSWIDSLWSSAAPAASEAIEGKERIEAKQENELQGQSTKKERREKGKKEISKQKDENRELNQSQKKFKEQADKIRKKVVKLDGLKCEWEMLERLWKQNSPKNPLFFKTIGEARSSYKELKEFHSKSEETHTEIKKLLENRKESSPIQQALYTKLEKEEKIIRIAREHMKIRLPKAATALQSLYDYKSNPVIAAYNYSLGLTPDVDALDLKPGEVQEAETPDEKKSDSDEEDLPPIAELSLKPQNNNTSSASGKELEKTDAGLDSPERSDSTKNHENPDAEGFRTVKRRKHRKHKTKTS